VALSCAGLALPATALARPYLPPKGEIFHGVSDTGNVDDFFEFERLVDAHSAVMQSFEVWGQKLEPAILRWHDAATRGMISLSTHSGSGIERISPAQISRGLGDGYVLYLNRTLAKEKAPAYVRLFPEMNGHWNQYSAFNSTGTARPDHSTKQFRRAWRRIALILRGGQVTKINRKLKRRQMHPLRPKTRHSPYQERKGSPKRLPKPKVALMWVPQTHGSPATHANRPAAYWPGRGFVDWVGADMYSRFENFAGFDRFLKNGHWKHLPFVVGEYAPWGEDDRPFILSMFRWVREHPRARMLAYYQDFGPDGGNPFRLQNFPNARKRVAIELDRNYVRAFAPGLDRQRETGGVRK
jgi:hypothetical protein